MHTFAIILTIFASVLGLEWLLRNALALRVWHSIFTLTPESEKQNPVHQTPLLSIIVAAKDEEAHIESCLKSLLAQDYPNIEIVVVNDRSEDATAEIIQKIAADEPRVRPMTITELPDGWCGKNHAMQKGIAQAKGDWICMTDADCTQNSTRTMCVAMYYALRTKTDMLSLLPTMTMLGFWEKFLLPILSGVLMVWFPPKKVNNPKSSTAYANGMFMLIRREAYQAIGTHEKIKGSLIEDMDMARNIKAAGLKLNMVPTRGLFSVRMYSSLSQIVTGWVRIFLGSFGSLTGLVKALLVLIGRGLMPTITTVLGFTMYGIGAHAAEWWLVCGYISAASLVAQLIMTARFYHYAGAPWILGCFYPIGCSCVVSILLKTILKLRPGAKMTWRGTHYNAK